jgi:hypothetical protein
MNKTEHLAHNWLISKGYTGLRFHHRDTPDFTTEQGKGFEVKLVRNGTILFSFEQFAHMMTVDNSFVLAFSDKPVPDAIIPVEDLRNGINVWKNIQLVVPNHPRQRYVADLKHGLAVGNNILRGSLTCADDTTQIIWVKYLAMANEAHDPFSGRLEFAKGDPYTVEYLAMQCRKSVPEVLAAEKLFMLDLNKSDGSTPRLIIEPDGTRVLSNWHDKQNRKEGKRPVKEVGGNGNKPDKMPLTADEKIQRRKQFATEMGYEYPDEVQIGRERKLSERRHKDNPHTL